MTPRGKPNSQASGVSLVDEVAALLRERIYDGRYGTGVWLRQEQLSQELGVSRTPLREAIRQLEQDGLVRLEPGRGARVITGDISTLRDAYELRAVVDGLAARLTAERGIGDRIRFLRRAIDHQCAALEPWQPRVYTQHNVDFHEQIMYASGNEFVVGQSPLLRMTAQVFAPVSVVEPTRARRAIQEHSAIADAIEAGDADEAERVARAHIEATLVELRRSATIEVEGVS